MWMPGHFHAEEWEQYRSFIHASQPNGPISVFAGVLMKHGYIGLAALCADSIYKAAS